MNETDGRLAPVIYLPGVQPPSVSSAPAAAPADDARASDWNTSWSDDHADSAGDEHNEFEAYSDSNDVDDPASPAEQAATAEKVSLGALARRGISQRELERILRDRGLDEATVSNELDRLIRVGLIDDLALAQTLVGTLQERKGLGRTAIAAELTRRMLAPSAIEYALDLVDTGDELARAKELALKRASQLRSLDRDAAVRRLSGYLMRRGYSGSTVRAAVDQALPFRPSGATGTVRFR